MPLAGLNKVCKLNTAYRLSAISCLPLQTDERGAHLVGADAEIRAVGVLFNHIVQRAAGHGVERVPCWM